MNVATTVELRGNVTEAVDRKIASVQPERLRNIIRDPLRGFWRDHLKALPGNKRGWPSTGFWEQAADSVDAIPSGATDLLLRATKTGLRQRYQGGTIKKRDKKLAIPARAEFYGHAPREFTNLHLVVFKSGSAALVIGEKGSSRLKQTKKGVKEYALKDTNAGLVAFWLVDQVTQQGNPNVVPPMDEFAAVAMSAIERALPSGGAA